MKKIIAFFLVIIVFSAFYACTPATPMSYNPDASAHVLFGWKGDFVKEKLQSTIVKYQEDYQNFKIETVKSGTSISFETDFTAASASVSLLSPVDNRNPEIELTMYIDLAVQTKCEGNRVTVYIDWWDGEGSMESSFPVWAYLVRVYDNQGTVYYHYFRVDYSACIK